MILEVPPALIGRSKIPECNSCFKTTDVRHYSTPIGRRGGVNDNITLYCSLRYKNSVKKYPNTIIKNLFFSLLK